MPKYFRISTDLLLLIAKAMSSTLTVVDPLRAQENHAPRILAVCAVFHFTALIVSGLRAYTRLFLVRSFEARDIVMILATVRPSNLSTP